jgi:hypothetical protein
MTGAASPDLTNTDNFKYMIIEPGNPDPIYISNEISPPLDMIEPVLGATLLASDISLELELIKSLNNQGCSSTY